jgi:hypothetical protein
MPSRGDRLDDVRGQEGERISDRYVSSLLLARVLLCCVLWLLPDGFYPDKFDGFLPTDSLVPY